MKQNTGGSPRGGGASKTFDCRLVDVLIVCSIVTVVFKITIVSIAIIITISWSVTSVSSVAPLRGGVPPGPLQGARIFSSGRRAAPALGPPPSFA